MTKETEFYSSKKNLLQYVVEKFEQHNQNCDSIDRDSNYFYKTSFMLIFAIAKCLF